MNIKDRVQKILKTSGLSASEFSKKLNIQRSRLSHILSGRNKPTLEIISRINRNFPKYTLNWLINGVEPTPTDPFNSGDNNMLEKKISNDSKKKINKIILFYDDETFETFEK